ncbi:NUDIX hydrolase [Ferrimonas aestuarii]|uniref:NUDIX domain-containing protein n=1 Tax=Ferrimonas aestuarii TaxID=2569539 RepID=A0A4U1BMN9_9GAMM|nr:NUDIX hydrolase [Ferrimonas aestuarii]TKB54560.1 NUDIX domain-containing protein [Ferrimonas aestuarii]
MKLLRHQIHHNAVNNGSEFARTAVRAIIQNGDKILLMYTARYDDYSLPGGGVDAGESLTEALLREVREETGAQNLIINQELGVYEELRPWYKDDYDNVRMHSYCYLCSADNTLGQNQLEDYEQANGMTPLWVELDTAIAHNLNVIKNSPKAGLSIERETWILQQLKPQQFEQTGS